jgi:hypothetical protein
MRERFHSSPQAEAARPEELPVQMPTTYRLGLDPKDRRAKWLLLAIAILLAVLVSQVAKRFIYLGAACRRPGRLGRTDLWAERFSAPRRGSRAPALRASGRSPGRASPPRRDRRLQARAQKSRVPERYPMGPTSYVQSRDQRAVCAPASPTRPPRRAYSAAPAPPLERRSRPLAVRAVVLHPTAGSTIETTWPLRRER